MTAWYISVMILVGRIIYNSAEISQIRLVNGTDESSGRLEVNINNTWGTVCSIGFGEAEARAVCRQLGYHGGYTVTDVSRYGEGTGVIIIENLDCPCSLFPFIESHIKDCNYIYGLDLGNNCTHSNDVGVICTKELQIRLVNGTDETNGRLEINLEPQGWGTVCGSNMFTEREAWAVCFHLGFYGGVPVKNISQYGEGSGPIYLDSFSCDLDAKDINHCSYELHPCRNCSHYQDVGVICTNEPIKARLVDGTDETNGRLEVYLEPNGWGTVCDLGFYAQDLAIIICWELGFYGGVLVTNTSYFGDSEGTGPVYLDILNCYGLNYRYSISGCNVVKRNSCTHRHEIRIKCTRDAPVRLVNGTSKCSGRVEIYQEPGGWDTAYSGCFDDRKARVVCRQLGYKGGIARYDNYYGKGSVEEPRYLPPIECQGDEDHILNCTGNYYEFLCEDAAAWDDVGVECNCENLETLLIKPSYGPVSGGTEVTMTGINLRGNDVKGISLGNVSATVLINRTTEEVIVFQTPKVPKAEPMDIYIIYNNQSIIASNLSFTYKPDPIVNSIYPLNSIVSGGIKLTIDGLHMDSVDHPKLSIIMTDQLTKDKVNVSSDCDKHSITGTRMECPTPDTKLSKADDVDEYDFYIGLTLDGVPTYRNVSETLPKYGKLLVYQDPSFEEIEEAVIINNEESRDIQIQGTDMNKGCSPSDYKIQIGLEMCDIQELKDNLVICKAPASNPDQSSHDMISKLQYDQHYIMISVGNLVDHNIGIVMYQSSFSVYFVAGVSSGAVLLIIIVVTVVCIIMRGRRSSSNNERGDQTDSFGGRQRNNQTGDQSVPMSTRSHHTAANLSTSPPTSDTGTENEDYLHPYTAENHHNNETGSENADYLHPYTAQNQRTNGTGSENDDDISYRNYIQPYTADNLSYTE